MKTPRETLLERHAWAEGRLDRLRQQVLAGELSQDQPADDRRRVRPALGVMLSSVVRSLGRDFFWGHRRTWGTLAAIWLLLWLTNFGNGSSQRAAMTPDTSRQVMALLRERARVKAEFAREHLGPAYPRKPHPSATPPPPPRPTQVRHAALPAERLT